MPNLDDEYEEYLWGEASPRSFARKAKFGMKRQKREPVSVVQAAEIVFDTDVDVSAFVPK